MIDHTHSSYVLDVGGGEYANLSVQLALPPVFVVLFNDIDNVPRAYCQLIILLGCVAILHLTLTNIWEREGEREGGRERERGERERDSL